MQPIDRLLSAFAILSCRPNVQSAARYIVSMRVPVPLQANDSAAGTGTVSVAFSNGEMERVDVPLRHDASDLIKDRRAEVLALTSSGPKTIDDDKVATFLLGQALRFLHADVHGDASVYTEMLAENASMFGAKGRANVVKFKRAWLRDCSSSSSAGADRNVPLATLNYDVDAVHHVDVENRVVVANFRCLLPGREGLGTDVLKFDSDFKILRVEALRHQ